MGTSVPAIQFTATGFVGPSQSAILAGVIADMQAAFGGNLNLSISDPSSLATPQGQLATSWAATIAQANDEFLLQSTQTDPAYAFGRWQDAIARIYFLERIGAQPTVIQVVCVGLVGVTIPVNAIVQDGAGNLYGCTTEGVIQSGGTVTLPFANLIPGPTAVPGTDEISIYQSIPGWDSVTVASGVLGNDTESRSAFEVRRAETVAGNSFGAVGAIVGAVSRVSGVSDYWAYDNTSSAPVSVQGVTVPAKSIYVTAVGGSDADVAQAILSKKAPGCGYGGNTTVTVYDSNPLYTSPIAYSVTFERPAALQVLFAVNIVNGPSVPSNAAALIQSAIIAAFAGSDGGPRARVGGTILATRFVAPVAALGTWAQIRSLLVGSNNTSAATFTGAIAGTALSVSGVSGTIAVGQTVSGVGVVAGTRIVSGSGSSWVVSVSQTVTSEAMTSAVAASNSVTVNANQEPEIATDNIVVTIT